MPRLEQTIDAVFSDRDITPSDVPQLDLYMDQVLTLFDRTLSESKRAPGDKLLTKTMVNNYVKEGLILYAKGIVVFGAFAGRNLDAVTDFNSFDCTDGHDR